MGESRKQLQTRLLKNILKFSMKEQEDLLETKKGRMVSKQNDKIFKEGGQWC